MATVFVVGLFTFTVFVLVKVKKKKKHTQNEKNKCVMCVSRTCTTDAWTHKKCS